MNVSTVKKVIAILSIVAVFLSFLAHSSTISMVAVIICTLASIVLLLRYLPQLSDLSPDNPKIHTLRWITVAGIIIALGCIVLAVLNEKGLLSLTDSQSSWLIAGLFSGIIIGIGNSAPKIPFNRYTGLRLPWTVRDENTWIAAHRILGYCSIPCGLLCFAGIGNLDLTVHICVAMLLLWVLIPAVLSCLFYYQKWHKSRI